MALNCYIQLATQHDNDPGALFDDIAHIALLEQSGSHITDMEKFNGQSRIIRTAVQAYEKKSRRREWVLIRVATKTSYPFRVSGGNNLSGRESYEAAVDQIIHHGQHLNGASMVHTIIFYIESHLQLNGWTTSIYLTVTMPVGE